MGSSSEIPTIGSEGYQKLFGRTPGTAESWHATISPEGPFFPEPGRYHLYIGLFCPFAHRANLARHLKGLTSFIDISVAMPYPKGDDKGWPGWRFPESDDEYALATTDKLFGSKYMHDIYFKADKDYKGRYSVPVLWDKKSGTIVNNESAEILRFLGSAFDTLLPDDFKSVTFYPPYLRERIDEICSWMQSDLNAGVYKTGFAPNQEVYNKHVVPVFDALNRLEILLAESRGPYILGKELTEVDIRAYVTMVRFDTVYVQHFKCNLGTIRHNYPLLNNWMKNLYWNVAGFGKETTNFRHIKENYTKSHYDINPKAITPMGPIPSIERGVETDYSKLRIGHVHLVAEED